MSRLPRLVIDARMVSPVPHGMARYVDLMARGLSELHAESPLPYEPRFLRGRADARSSFHGFGVIAVDARFLAPQELIEIPLALRAVKADAYHSPTFSSLVKCPCPYLVTVHDLNHLEYGSWSKKLYYKQILKPFARKAAALLSVSEFSLKEIDAWIGPRDPGQTFEVVYNALEPAWAEPLDPAPVLSRLKLERGKFFVCLSNPKPHKNVATLVEAYRRWSGGWPLVLNFRDPALPVPAGVYQAPSLSDSDARALVQASGGMLFPSIYEGFGLPPLEGAVAGAPIAVSDIAPHREGLASLKEGEALWVAPRDVEGWVEALRRLSTGAQAPVSPESRAELLQRFSMRRLARGMDRIYRRVLGLGSV